MQEWENDRHVVENMSDKVIKVIESLKLEFPRLQKWDNIKIISLFCENWKNADI